MSRRNHARTLTKASTAVATTYSPEQVVAMLRIAVGGTLAKPLPRLDPVVPFGPGVPLNPAPINPVRPDTGRAEPRGFEYPVTWNLPGFGDRLIPWKVLRDAADMIPLIRRCIEIRKAEVATLDWDVTISAKAIERAQRQSPGTTRVEVEEAMRRQVEPHIGRLVDFWEQPDPRNGHDFISWACKVLEEYFVLDAISIYPRLRRNGDLYGLEVLDGSTIKPLLDNDGFRPLPPQPAYQQILYGFPRGEFVADGQPDPDTGMLPGAFPADRLVYKVHNVRSFTPYGFSAVEQALYDGDLWLRRMGWLKAEYTEGVMPSGWLKAGVGQAEWSPQQLREYEQALNDYYAGNSSARQRYRMLPYGMEPVESPDLNERYRPDYDLFLIKLVAAHLDTTIAELGFTEQGGLGSTGWHEGQADVQNRKATQPTLRRLQALCTMLQRRFCDAPPELEFRILGLESEDEQAADEVSDRRVKRGAMTLNEDRDRTGLPRYSFPEADMPMVDTGRGVVFLQGASKLAPPGTMLGPPQAPAQEPGQEPGKAEPAQAAKAELVAYRRWLAKGKTTRPFHFEHLSPMEASAAGVQLDKAEFGGDPPRAPKVRHWPGWERDLAVAEHWAPIILQASTGLRSARKLVADAAAGWKRDGANGVARSLAHLDYKTAFAPALRGMWTDGYVVGAISSRMALSHAGLMIVKAEPNVVTLGADWGNWTPGDKLAAQQILSREGMLDRLMALVDQGDVVADQIAVNRLDALARELIKGLSAGDAPAAIATRIRGLVGDPKWAYRVAVTETSRAVSAATLVRYGRNGVEAVEWMTALDQRVCSQCQINEDQGPVPLFSAFPDGNTAPPGHVLCFPAGTVVAGPSVLAATARRYEGDLITVVFAGGQELAVTPNHPVLTLDGWMPAGDLHEGAQVLRAPDVQRVLDLIDPDDRQTQASIEDVAGALGEASQVIAVAVPATAEDFHGDGGSDEQVEVVLAQRDAVADRVAEPVQQGAEDGFQLTARLACLALRGGDQRGEAVRAAPAGLMRRGDHLGALLGASALPAEHHRRGPIPAIDASLAEHPVDGRTLQTVPARQCLDRLAAQERLDQPGRGRSHASGLPGRAQGDVALDETLPERLVSQAAQVRALLHACSGLVELDCVLEVRRDPHWVGHVYNLETSGGWYLADGVIVHNCRCALAPAWITVEDEVRSQAALTETMTAVARAQARYAQIAAVKDIADLVAKSYQWVEAEAEGEVIARSLTAAAEASGVDASALVAAASDPATLLRAADEMASQAGLTRLGTPGERVLYDPKVYEAVGRIQVGTPVEVLEPGFTARLSDGEMVRLSKPVVVEAAPIAPAEVTGSSETWLTGLPDTGLERPLPVRNLVIHQSPGDYVISEGWAYKIDGVGYVVEKGTGRFTLGAGVDESAARARVKDLVAFQRSLGEPGRLQKTYTVTVGANPSDAYWAQKYNRPNFRSAAMASDGHTTLWDPAYGSHDAELLHEFGHNVDAAARALGLDSSGLDWTRASAGAGARGEVYDFTPTGRGVYGSHAPTLADDPAALFPAGVTGYGRSSVVEDFAESVQMHLIDRIQSTLKIGTARLSPGGPLVDVTFADLFPARAKVLDRIFAHPATRVLGTGGPAAPIEATDLSRMTVAQLRVMARERGLTGYSGMRKPQLLEALGNPPAADLSRMTVAQLRELAKDRGITLVSGDRKAQILAKLRNPAPPIDPLVAARTFLAEHPKPTLAQLRKAGIERVGTVSKTKTVPYDPAVHEVRGPRPAMGAPVRVVEPGYTVTVRGETVELSRPVVEVVPELPSAVGDILARALAGEKSTALREQLAGVLDGPLGEHMVKVTRVTTDSVTGVMRVTGQIADANGTRVARFAREYLRGDAGELVAHHDYLSVGRRYQGQGLAQRFNDRLMQWYRDSGVARIELYANIDVGGYTWASAGFDFADSRAAQKILYRLEGLLQATTYEKPAGLKRAFRGASAEHIQAMIDEGRRLLARVKNTDFGSTDFPTAYEISQVGRWLGAGKTDIWLGKAVMLDSAWEAVLPL